MLFFGQIERSGQPLIPMPRASSPNSIDSRITSRVKRSPRGTVFTPGTFAGLGSRAAIDKTLQRLVADGVLRRLSRGLYDKPRQDDVLGTLWPPVDAVVRAIVGKDRIRVQPAGAYAANLLGLSEQVPAEVVLMTDGASRSVKAGPMRVSLRRTSPRSMATADRLSGLLIQAFKSLGKQHITPQHIARLRETIPAPERSRLLADLNLAPAWMQPLFRKIAQDGEGSAKKVRAGAPL